MLTIVSQPAPALLTTSGDSSLEKHALKRVHPQYPPLAKKLAIQGVVSLDISVGMNGKVSKAEFIKGHNIFRAVSLDAVKRWEFESGRELRGTIRMIFELDD
jgi:protein TonB